MISFFALALLSLINVAQEPWRGHACNGLDTDKWHYSIFVSIHLSARLIPSRSRTTPSTPETAHTVWIIESRRIIFNTVMKDWPQTSLHVHPVQNCWSIFATHFTAQLCFRLFHLRLCFAKIRNEQPEQSVLESSCQLAGLERDKEILVRLFLSHHKISLAVYHLNMNGRLTEKLKLKRLSRLTLCDSFCLSIRVFEHNCALNVLVLKTSCRFVFQCVLHT
jgi:hypothetical protein